MAKSIAASGPQAPDQIRQIIANIQTVLGDTLLPTGSDKAHANITIATTTTKVRTNNAVYGIINGALFTKASTDNLWTLAGTVTNAKFNVFVLTLNVSGTAGAYMGTEGATLAAVTFPSVPTGEIVVGFVIINPTGTGNFVGGTTALTDATVVPNAVYINSPEFNPNILSLPNTY